jgi:hypothetical protein
MKRILLTLATISMISICEASRPNTYEVDDRGVVSKGSSKLGSLSSSDINFEDFNSRKPSRYELTDVDPRQMK